MGHTIAYVDGGFHLIMTAVPVSQTKPDIRLQRKEHYDIIATELFNDVVERFQVQLRELPQKEKARASIRKQGMWDTSRYHVLMRDQRFLMILLDRVIEQVNDKSHVLKVGLFLNQFGQKERMPFELIEVFDDFEDIRSMSVHFGCSVSALDPTVNILLSRYGLQGIVGLRGAMFMALGIHEAVNFQSNFNNVPMDVGQQLMPVMSRDGKVTFLQLYVDSPHAHSQMPFKHPVSGVLVTCGLSHPNYHRSCFELHQAYGGLT